MYVDNTTTTLTPQDANSLAVLYNITVSHEQALSISKGLRKNWNELGPVAPELPDTISPFISGFEVKHVDNVLLVNTELSLVTGTLRSWGR